MAKSISSIFLSEEDITNKASIYVNKGYTQTDARNMVLTEMLTSYNSCTGDSKDIAFAESELILKSGRNSTNKYYEYACICYEYMQFKRSVFECKNIVYDENVTGRVTGMEFDFVKVR